MGVFRTQNSVVLYIQILPVLCVVFELVKTSVVCNSVVHKRVVNSKLVSVNLNLLRNFKC